MDCGLRTADCFAFHEIHLQFTYVFGFYLATVGPGKAVLYSLEGRASGIICPASAEEIAATVVDRVLGLAGLDVSSFRWGE